MSMQPIKSPSALDMCNTILGYNGEDFLYKGTGGYVVKPDQRLSAPTSPQKDEFLSSSSASSNLAFAGGVTLLAAGILFRKNIGGLFKNFKLSDLKAKFSQFKASNIKMPEFKKPEIKMPEYIQSAKTHVISFWEKMKSVFTNTQNSSK